MWGMMGGIGIISGYGSAQMPYRWGHMGYGMGLTLFISLFVIGGIFGALAAWFYNLALCSGSTEVDKGSSSDQTHLATSK